MIAMSVDEARRVSRNQIAKGLHFVRVCSPSHPAGMRTHAHACCIWWACPSTELLAATNSMQGSAQVD